MSVTNTFLLSLLMFAHLTSTPRLQSSLQVAATEATPTPCFALSVTSKAATDNSGSIPEVQIKVTNSTNHEEVWSFPKTDVVYKSFRFRLEKDGQEVRTTYFHRKITGRQGPGDPQDVDHTSSIALPIASGSSFVWSIDLLKLYEISRPGTYQLLVSHRDECSHSVVYASTINVVVH